LSVFLIKEQSEPDLVIGLLEDKTLAEFRLVFFSKIKKLLPTVDVWAERCCNL
jgi:hypothetical protein